MTAKKIPEQNLKNQLTADHARTVNEFMTIHEDRLTKTAATGKLWPAPQTPVKPARMTGEQHRQPFGEGQADCVRT